jgi:hypothetical protein
MFLHLGLNPGIANNSSFRTSLWEDDVLLKEPSDGQPDNQHWINARKLYCANEKLMRLMKRATFSFLIPWRTPEFNTNAFGGLRNYNLAFESSKVIFNELYRQLQPKTIILSGVETAKKFHSKHFLDEHLYPMDFPEKRNKINQNNTYQWRVWKKKDLTIILVPHFSRANSEDYLKIIAEKIATEL